MELVRWAASSPYDGGPQQLTSVLMARIFNGDTLIWATSRNSSLSQSVSATASIDFL